MRIACLEKAKSLFSETVLSPPVFTAHIVMRKTGCTATWGIILPAARTKAAVVLFTILWNAFHTKLRRCPRLIRRILHCEYKRSLRRLPFLHCGQACERLPQTADVVLSKKEPVFQPKLPAGRRRSCAAGTTCLQ